MGKIAKVRNYSRHDTIIVNGNKYTKDKWSKICADMENEELTIMDEFEIEEPVSKKPAKKYRGEE